jgi:hypothetical protein
MPKGVFGLRLTTLVHYKYSTLGHREMLRLMYGLSRSVTIMVSPIVSNFHLESFPADLNAHYKNFHNHQAGSSYYPHAFEGVHVYTKWRFLTRDGKNEHFRMALYNELAYSRAPHIDALPTLMGDNPGASLGLIATKLHKKFAVSATTGFTNFFEHTDHSDDIVKFKPGKAFNANLSLGYLTYPKTYTDYNDLNINLYLESALKIYQRPVIRRNDVVVNSDQFPYLRAGSAFYIYPSVQFIVNSKTRIDLAVELPLYYSNDLPKYEMMIVSLQHYFF